MSILLKFSCLIAGSLLLNVKACNAPKVSVLDTAEYITWVENPENGLAVSKEMNGMTYSLQYKPLEYEVLLQEKREMNSVEMALETDSISGMQYYTFRIAATNGSDVQRYQADGEEEYYARLEYFAMQMQNDVVLIEGTDTLPCLLYHYERTYGIDPRAAFVMGFARTESKNNKTLMFTDRVYGSGPVLLTIESSDLEIIPELNLPE